MSVKGTPQTDVTDFPISIALYIARLIWTVHQWFTFDWSLANRCLTAGADNAGRWWPVNTVYPKKYARGFCFAVLCCGCTLTDFPISIRLTSLALWQSNDCPSASKATLMNMDKYFMWIHYERLHNHNKAKHNKTVCIFLGIYCNSQGDLRAAFKCLGGYRQTSNIRRTKSQNLNVSRLVLQLSLPSTLKPVTSRMKM